jgi:two-component system, sensor histidine kinase PdtaS
MTVDGRDGQAREPSLDRRIEETESRFRTMADQAPVLLWMAGRDGLCAFFNQTWLRFTGRALEEEMGNGWAEGVHAEDFSHCMQVFLEAFVAHRPFAMEYRLRRYDGEYRWILDQGAPRFEGDEFVGFIGSCVDITPQREARDALSQLNQVLEQRVRDRTALAAERETLLREVHHRVKNDLQLISSLLAMHGRELGDDGAASAFEQCQERVQAIARVHEQMYQSIDLHEMCFSEHLRALALDVRATGASPAGVELVLDIGENVMLGVDQAIPCAMVVHELLVNAFKHAFPEGRRGSVRVSCRDEGDGNVAVSVEDDGIGMTSLTGAHGTGLGWTLVDAFVRQLGAKLEFDISHGTRVRLCFAGARASGRRRLERAKGSVRGVAAPARESSAVERLPEPEVS